MEAVAHLQSQGPTDTPAAVTAAGAAAGEEANVPAGNGDGTEAVPPDSQDALAPLDVELGLASGGAVLPGQAAGVLKPLVGGGLATRLARSPSGLRPVRLGSRGSLTALISGRLMSAALGSMGLTGAGTGTKKTAAVQAVQAARRRILMRAASNAAAEETAAAVANAATAEAATVATAAADVDLAIHTAAQESVSPGNNGDTSANAPAVQSSIVGPSSCGGRHIVWDPDKLPKLPAAGQVQLHVKGTAAAGARLEDSAAAVAPPPAKRARIWDAAAAADASPPRSSSAGEDGRKEQAPGHRQADTGAMSGGMVRTEEGHGGEMRVDGGQQRGAGGDEEPPGHAGAVSTSGASGSRRDTEGDTEGERQRVGRGDRVGDPDLDALDSRSRPKRTDSAAEAGTKDPGSGRSSRLLGTALAGSAKATAVAAAAASAAAIATSSRRPRAPIHTGAPAGCVSRSSPTAIAAPSSDDATDTEVAAVVAGSGRTAPRSTYEADGSPGSGTAVTGTGAGKGVATSARGGAQHGGGSGGSGAAAGPTGLGSTERGTGAGALVSPAGKLFGAAMRQLQRRSQG
ncbi:hypothetical protein VOLCADRAFT_103063 [Volvox carteri f. nagariensis]|uniref:Uncharacterized protein n=1 Tax=Volvox carteri f. nagariensis TaxID=3068 RepID=D8TJP0_VOLCA|nr:uncharacterized protein VOLCADRAFT_103063 [Volvox carteri f. nagariensis]EFJ52576.1 hypothetical protein VOLCADRAFT_103063 [Volvox carteri f. nagariensis]|eukprot:XP_002946649.1 hypothetical protein VOLCADRAFT_103063 [Volvox carteri f. nagariensis]